jgi:hypothetical protein
MLLMLKENKEQEMGLKPRGMPLGDQADLSKYPKGKKLPIPQPKKTRRGR